MANGDEVSISEFDYRGGPAADVDVVETVEDAERVVAVLMKLKGEAQCPIYHALDTEVVIDVKKETPVGHGHLICFSVYCGPDVDFGRGFARLWVDLDRPQEERIGIIEAFRPYLESADIPKVWHNYGFDRHIFENVRGRDGSKLKLGGFGGDTMHMARLWDSSRNSYSLEDLSSDKALMKDEVETHGGDWQALRAKRSMKKLFGKAKLKKDGTPSKLTYLPAVDEIQRSDETRERWIDYSALDAQATWYLRNALEGKLRGEPSKACAELGKHESFVPCATLWDFYQRYTLPFGNILTDMESEGMLVDRVQLRTAEALAKEHQEAAEHTFRDWATSFCADAKYMNVGSGPQVRQLLFAGAPNKSASKPPVPESAEYKTESEEWKAWDAAGREGKAPRKMFTYTLHGHERGPLPVKLETAGGQPAVSAPVLRGLAGKAGEARELLRNYEAKKSEAGVDKAALAAVVSDAEKRLGSAFKGFGGGEEGLRGCAAIDALCDSAAIETLLSNFIVPLQGDNLRGDRQRVHCSLNINTETGRLSARRPNLQNQPALEKDRYGIRKAFTCEEGNALVVADYGQLELRLLAHMASCSSMLEAFKLGGDFHSRTALGMYSHIQKAIEREECLLEWSYPNGEEPPVPLLKDLFASERRKAKVLNFSIAYGKTAHGLARDWGTSTEEAQETVDAWYGSRPEVKEWQHERHEQAKAEGRVYTLLGRHRQLPDAMTGNQAAKAHALRAAINTPIQGGAADIAMLAMIQIMRCEQLKAIGYKLLMQVHDEVILEGPEENVEEAQRLVVEAMANPFNGRNLLNVELVVDANHAKTWYEAK
mmetsp:Transcript_24591/g.80380  ORF Transcript_24591/g.80380 Transcript_24591/m.80380 type:complete len:825 (-) Transcript_24591:45-2519(-)